MSEDSSDNDDISVVRSSTKKRIKKSLILSDDSSGDEDKNDTLRSYENSKLENEVECEENGIDESINLAKAIMTGGSDEESTDLNSSTKKKRIQQCLDDSSDEEDSKIRKAIQASNQKISDHSSSEDNDDKSSDDSSDDGSSKPRKKIKKSLSKRNKSSMGSSSSSNDSSRCSTPTGSINDEKNTSLASSPSQSRSNKKRSNSSSNSSHSSSEDELVEKFPSNTMKADNHGSKQKEKKQSRKSKEAAMKEIYSESSRMIRESAVGLPYHRPRQRSLKEFLNRKKALPNILPVQKGIKLSRGSNQLESTSGPGLFAEELEQLLNEREKKVEQFFKEENNDDNEKDIESNHEAKDLDDNKEMSNDIGKISEDPNTNNEHKKDAESKDVSHNTSVLDTSRPLMLEEGSSDDNDNEKDLEKIFSPSVDLPTICSDNVKENVEVIVNQNQSSEIRGKEQDKQCAAGQVKDMEINQFKLQVDDMRGENTYDNLGTETESLRLFLEPEDDTSEHIVNRESEQTQLDNGIASDFKENKNIDDASKEYKESSRSDEESSKVSNKNSFPELKETIAKLGAPKLGKFTSKHSGQAADDFLTFEVDRDEYTTEDKGLSDLKNRFVKHVKCSRKMEKASKATDNEPVQMTIVSKETDSRGREHLKTQTLNYVSNGQSPNPKKEINFEKVRMAKKSERIGAQHVSLKMILKEKIDQKRKTNLMKKEEKKKMDNEEQTHADIESDKDEEEEILDDEETSEESEEEYEEGMDWDEEEAKLEAEDRRKERKRIKQGSFLDDEAEDDDAISNSLFESQKEELVNDVNNVPPQSSLLVDSEDILASNIGNDKALRANQELKTTQSTPISIVKETKQADFFAEPFNDNSASARKKLGFGQLFDTTDPKVDDMDDVIGLCSGQFLTQPNMVNSSQDTMPNIKSQSQFTQDMYDTPDTVILTQNLDESQNGNSNYSENLLDPEFSSQKKSLVEAKEKSVEPEEIQPGFMQDDIGALGLLSSSEDENVTMGDKRLVAKSKKMKKRKRLVVSDDDSDSDNGNDHFGSEKDEQKEGTDIMYDSEENEIEPGDMAETERVEFRGFKNKKGGLRKEFVEEEAELSGDSNDELNISEDEDERGMNRLMLEEGDMDEECADEDELRDQVGKLHHRAILDQDQREVRLFQEAFLEDGELHSDNGRARKFRWKDTDDDVELERRSSDDEGANVSGEYVQDEKWRVERLEREKWLKETEIGQDNKNKIKQNLGVECVNDDDSDNEDSQFFNLATKALKKLNKSHISVANTSKTSSMSSIGGDTLMSIAKDIGDSNSNTSKEIKKTRERNPLQMVSNNTSFGVRGSFLSRCSSDLEKLAEMTKSTTENRSGSGAKNTKNFVFALLSPEKSKKNKNETLGSNAIRSTDSDVAQIESKRTTKNSNIDRAPDSKKIKIDRSISENCSDSIFSLM